MRTLGNRTVLLLALALVAAAPAAALDLDANIDPTNSSVANGITVDANGNAQAELTAGDW